MVMSIPSEKAISIGQYFVTSGVYTVFGVTFSMEVKKLMGTCFQSLFDISGG
jgi:hypothetical protein